MTSRSTIIPVPPAPCRALPLPAARVSATSSASVPSWQRARSSAGEHYVDIVGVTGSIPVAPTIFINNLRILRIHTVAHRKHIGNIGKNFGTRRRVPTADDNRHELNGEAMIEGRRQFEPGPGGSP